jgi:hypothetical protein
MARQAINYVVDRNAVVRLYGGPNLAQPVCTILPPGFPGHVDSCTYTKGGGTTWSASDMDKAKSLVQQSGTAGQEVGIVVTDDEVNKAIGEYLQSVLTELGYKAVLKPLSANIQFTYIQNTNNKTQLALTSWYQDYPAASDFINVLLSCASFHPGSDSSINIAGFCDKDIDAKTQDALHGDDSVAVAAASHGGYRQQCRVSVEPGAGRPAGDYSAMGEEHVDGCPRRRGQLRVDQPGRHIENIDGGQIEAGVEDRGRHRPDVEAHLTQGEQLVSGGRRRDDRPAQHRATGTGRGGGKPYPQPQRERHGRAAGRGRHDDGAVVPPSHRDALSKKGVDRTGVAAVGESQ